MSKKKPIYTYVPDTREWSVVTPGTHRLTLRMDGWNWAEVKWDGCIDYYRVVNDPIPDGVTELPPEEEPAGRLIDYMHICDIDEEIERLQKLKAAAIAFFGEDWGE